MENINTRIRVRYVQIQVDAGCLERVHVEKEHAVLEQHSKSGARSPASPIPAQAQKATERGDIRAKRELPARMLGEQIATATANVYETETATVEELFSEDTRVGSKLN